MKRHCEREFAPTPLSRQQLSHLLWAADGINRPALQEHTAPSAMNFQEIDPALAGRIDQVRALAREARVATTYEERGRVYGELISRCADCHYLARPAR